MKEEVSMPNGPQGPEGFTVSEEQLHKRLNMPRSWIRERRGPEGQWWARLPAGIHWTPAGVEALVAMITEKSAPDSEAEKPAADALPPDVVDTLVVWRSRLPNTRVVLAHEMGVDPQSISILNACTVYVGNSRHFVPGMLLLARRRMGKYFDFAGNPENPAAGRRLPRRPGRW